jgi:hypothetical protein
MDDIRKPYLAPTLAVKGRLVTDTLGDIAPPVAEPNAPAGFPYVKDSL